MRRLAAWSAAIALVATFAAPTGAAAAVPQLSVSVTSVRLVSRIFVDVGVTVRCTLPSDAEWVEGGISIDLRQAVGNRQAASSTYVELTAEATCDGTPHSGVVRLQTEPQGRLFHAGRALINVEAGFYGWTEDEDLSISDGTGWMRTRLRR